MIIRTGIPTTYAQQLESLVRARMEQAGIVPAIVQVYLEGIPPDTTTCRLEIQNNLTPGQIAVLDAALANFEPDVSEETLATEMRGIFNQGVTAYRNWASLNNAQKDVVIKGMLRVMLIGLGERLGVRPP